MKLPFFTPTLAFGAALLFGTAVLAAPSPGIEKLLDTPASAFDVFLQRLYWAANGSTYFGGPMMKERLRIFNLEYDLDSNLITLKFHASPDHKMMKGFSEANLESKREMLTRAATDLAEALGVAPRNGKLRLGLIQMQEIRYGWVTKDLDERSIKEEIADRTEVELVYAYEDKSVYSVRRTLKGEYRFSIASKSQLSSPLQ